MATQKEILEQDLAEELEEAGPDSPLAKHLKAQIASLGTVRHPSQLAALNSSKSDKFHGAALRKPQSEAPDDPMLPAMNGLEDSLQANLDKHYRNTEQPSQAPSPSSGATSRATNGKD